MHNYSVGGGKKKGGDDEEQQEQPVVEPGELKLPAGADNIAGSKGNDENRNFL